MENPTCSNCEHRTGWGYCKILSDHNIDKTDVYGDEAYIKTPDDFCCNRWTKKTPVVCYLVERRYHDNRFTWKFYERTMIIENGVIVGTKNGLPVYLDGDIKEFLDDCI